MCSPQGEEDHDGASEDNKAQQAKATFLAVWCSKFVYHIC